MARMSVGNGCENYIKQLTELELNTETVIGKAVYVGAGIVADAVRANIEGLPERAENTRGTEKSKVSGVTPAQKTGLLNGLGIAKMRKDGGYYNVKIGMDGYNSTHTKAFPNGQPNAMVARGLESGTSWLNSNKFITQAVNSSRTQAEEAMNQALEEEINKIVR